MRTKLSRAAVLAAGLLSLTLASRAIAQEQEPPGEGCALLETRSFSEDQAREARDYANSNSGDTGGTFNGASVVRRSTVRVIRRGLGNRVIVVKIWLCPQAAANGAGNPGGNKGGVNGGGGGRPGDPPRGPDVPTYDPRTHEYRDGRLVPKPNALASGGCSGFRGSSANDCDGGSSRPCDGPEGRPCVGADLPCGGSTGIPCGEETGSPCGGSTGTDCRGVTDSPCGGSSYTPCDGRDRVPSYDPRFYEYRNGRLVRRAGAPKGDQGQKVTASSADDGGTTETYKGHPMSVTILPDGTKILEAFPSRGSNPIERVEIKPDGTVIEHTRNDRVIETRPDGTRIERDKRAGTTLQTLPNGERTLYFAPKSSPAPPISLRDQTVLPRDAGLS